MSEEGPDLAAIASLLEDETVREILTQTSLEPMSARRLKEHCDASGPTIYRRSNAFVKQSSSLNRLVPTPMTAITGRCTHRISNALSLNLTREPCQ